jgi:hypothetical protein
MHVLSARNAYVPPGRVCQLGRGHRLDLAKQSRESRDVAKSQRQLVVDIC